MRMKKVTKEELAAMDADSDRCAAELADARVDVLGYACLVAIMSMGHGYHCTSEARLREVTRREGADIPVVTSAGALVEGLRAMGAKRISAIAPYPKLTSCYRLYRGGRHPDLDVIAWDTTQSARRIR
jgi:maleate isomerase